MPVGTSLSGSSHGTAAFVHVVVSLGVADQEDGCFREGGVERPLPGNNRFWILRPLILVP